MGANKLNLFTFLSQTRNYQNYMGPVKKSNQEWLEPDMNSTDY